MDDLFIVCVYQRLFLECLGPLSLPLYHSHPAIFKHNYHNSDSLVELCSGSTVSPGSPFVPFLPGRPLVPGVPGGPLIPVLPGSPVIPGIPDFPGIPLAPGLPLVPSSPGDPSFPSLPAAFVYRDHGSLNIHFVLRWCMAANFKVFEHTLSRQSTSSWCSFRT